MTLTLIIDSIPQHQRAAALKYGKRDGPLVTIDAADLMRPAEPIPADTSPEVERRKAKQGGCCGEPSAGG